MTSTKENFVFINLKGNFPVVDGPAEHLHEAPTDGPNFVSSKFECSDFDDHTSKVAVYKAHLTGIPRAELIVTHRLSAFVLVGVLTGCLGGLVILCVEYGVHYKSEYLIGVFDKYDDDSNAIYPFMMFALLVWIPAFIGTALVIYIEPKAAGGGLPPVIAYVKGVKVPGALSLKTLVVKVFSVTCCMIAGLAAGMEAPMVHLGACTACSMTNMRLPFTNIEPFDNLHSDVDRRDLVAAGIAAGIVGAFSTPLGGCCMALEEGLTYYNVGLLFRLLVTSVSSAITVNVILTLVTEAPGNLTQRHLLFFIVVKESSTLRFYAVEFPFYIMVGVIGGLLGTAYNLIQIRLIVLRKKYVTKKWQQLVEMGVISTSTIVFYWILISSFRSYCIPIRPNTPHTLGEYQTKCGDSEYSTPSIFAFQSIPNIIRFMFQSSSDDVSVLPLSIFLIGFYLLAVCTMGTQISGGIFIPHLVIGATWGRIFGVVLRNVTGWNWIYPNKYAFLASGAQLTGSVRVPFTVGVLMLEATSTTALGYPAFTAVITSYVVASLFSESIYHHQCSMAGIATVETDPPPFCSQIKATELMSAPLISFPKIVTVDVVRNTLRNTSHNCFAILAPNGLLEGSISRGLLITLIKKGIFVEMPFDENLFDLLKNEFHSKQNLQMIANAPGDRRLDLNPYMDQTPFAVSEQTSYDSVYRLISCLGLRHIFVIDTGYKAVGIITRRKLSVYRLHVNAIHGSVVILPLR